MRRHYMNLTKRILPIALIGSAIVVGTVVLFEERVSEYTPFQPSIERETFTTMEEQLVQEEATSNLKDGEQFSEDKNSDKEKSLHQKTISGQTNSNLPKENTSNKINEIGGAVTALDIITETNAQRAKDQRAAREPLSIQLPLYRSGARCRRRIDTPLSPSR